MPEFESMFIESKGQPVEYSGKQICLVDRFPLADGDMIVVSIETTDSEWRQGVNIMTEGTFLVNDQSIPNSVVLWSDTAPPRVLFKIRTSDSDIRIRNVWDTGDGVMQSWHNGAAMIVDHLSESKRRYRCNDGHPDDNFTDIVLTIERE